MPVGRLRDDRPALHRRRAASVVHEQVYDAFPRTVRRPHEGAPRGDGLDPNSQMGPSVSESQRETVIKYVEIGRQEAPRWPAAATRLWAAPMREVTSNEPTVFADVAPSMRIAQEEIFGRLYRSSPAAPSRRPSQSAQPFSYGLSASIYTQDINRAFAAMRDMYTGIFYVNAPTIGGGSAPAVRRYEGQRQRPSRGRHRGAGRVLRVEVDLRRLQRPAAARHNRYGGL